MYDIFCCHSDQANSCESALTSAIVIGWLNCSTLPSGLSVALEPRRLLLIYFAGLVLLCQRPASDTSRSCYPCSGSWSGNCFTFRFLRESGEMQEHRQKVAASSEAALYGVFSLCFQKCLTSQGWSGFDRFGKAVLIFFFAFTYPRVSVRFRVRGWV